MKLGEAGIRQIWHDAKLRGRGYSRAGEIVTYARISVGIKDGDEVSKAAVKWFVEVIMELDKQLSNNREPDISEVSGDPTCGEDS